MDDINRNSLFLSSEYKDLIQIKFLINSLGKFSTNESIRRILIVTTDTMVKFKCFNFPFSESSMYEKLVTRNGKMKTEHIVFRGNEYLLSGILFFVYSNPKTEYPSLFFSFRYSLRFNLGTSCIGIHFSVVTL